MRRTHESVVGDDVAHDAAEKCVRRVELAADAAQEERCTFEASVPALEDARSPLLSRLTKSCGNDDVGDGHGEEPAGDERVEPVVDLAPVAELELHRRHVDAEACNETMRRRKEELSQRRERERLREEEGDRAHRVARASGA